MRYKFRGKRVDNGEWTVGFLIKDESGEVNIVNNYGTSYSWDEVDPETVGQYTGLRDRDGKEIYEGDIVRKIYKDYLEAKDYDAPLEVGSEWGGGTVINVDVEDDGWTELTLGGYHDIVTLERFRFWLRNEGFGYEGEDLQDPTEYEVIGTRWDNPELLGG